MTPQELDKKMAEIRKKSSRRDPLLKIKKYTGDIRFGRYIQLGYLEGVGRCLFTRTPRKFRVSVFPAEEIQDVLGISEKKMAQGSLF